MWTKQEILFRNHCIAPNDFKIPHREEVIGENGVRKVYFTEIESSKIDEQLLDPRVVNITNLLETNCIIPVGDAVQALKLSDIADIERFNDGQNEILYNFLSENKESIVAQLNKDNHES